MDAGAGPNCLADFALALCPAVNFFRLCEDAAEWII